MSDFTTIDPSLLALVSGGEGEDAGAMPTTSTSSSAGVQTPWGGANASTSTTTSEPNAYLRCLDLVGRQSGVMESNQAQMGRQQALCAPLLK